MPLAEHDFIPQLPEYPNNKFQFTCPSRSTTQDNLAHGYSARFQFTCPSRSTTPWGKGGRKQKAVSIHVPLAEHDALPSSLTHRSTGFQFTCPSRSTTQVHVPLALEGHVSIHVPLAEHDVADTDLYVIDLVSIHVPLAEHDADGAPTLGVVTGFNSRAPRGARRQ